MYLYNNVAQNIQKTSKINVENVLSSIYSLKLVHYCELKTQLTQRKLIL